MGCLQTVSKPTLDFVCACDYGVQIQQIKKEKGARSMKRFVTRALTLASFLTFLTSSLVLCQPATSSPPPSPSQVPLHVNLDPDADLAYIANAPVPLAIRLVPRDPYFEAKVEHNKKLGLVDPNHADAQERLGHLMHASFPLTILPDIGANSNIFGALGTNGCASASGRYPARGSDPGFDISRASFVRVQVWSSAGSSAIVTFDERSSRTGDALVAPWFTVTSPNNIVNPSVTGEYWFVPVSMDLSVNVPAATYSSGALCGNIETHQIGP